MGRKSSLVMLPPDLRKEIDRLLADGALTIAGIRQYIADQVGIEATPSASAIDRRAQDIKKVAARLRQSREMAEALVQQLGPDSSDGTHGRMLVQGMRTLVFELMVPKLMKAEGTQAFSTEDFSKISRAIKDMAQAVRYDQDFEMKLKAAAKKEAEAELEKAMKNVATGAGSEALSPQQILERVKAVYRGEA